MSKQNNKVKLLAGSRQKSQIICFLSSFPVDLYKKGKFNSGGVLTEGEIIKKI